jgi:hypothetical protein
MGNPLYNNRMKNGAEASKTMFFKDLKDAFDLGDRVFVVPRIRDIKEHADHCYLKSRKWGLK